MPRRRLNAAASASGAAGPRVLIRAPGGADLDEFTDLVRRSRTFHAGWVSPPRDPAQFSALLERHGEPEFQAHLIVRRTDGVILGAVNLSQIFRRGFQNAYLGYWIGAPYARCGYMTEGLTLALDHAFGPLRLHRLEANIQPPNESSRRLVERLGFRLEGYSPDYLKIGGRWRDHERWAILRNEWRARRSIPLAVGDPRRQPPDTAVR